MLSFSVVRRRLLAKMKSGSIAQSVGKLAADPGVSLEFEFQLGHITSVECDHHENPPI